MEGNIAHLLNISTSNSDTVKLQALLRNYFDNDDSDEAALLILKAKL
jgi:hypothetical protein